MKLAAVRHWLGLDHGAASLAPSAAPGGLFAPSLSPAPVRPAGRDEAAWSPERLNVVDALWGDGFQFPGGAAETLRLVTPLGLSAASSLLVVGAGSGGPPCCIAASMGVWVTGYESDRDLLAVAMERSLRSNLARRARIKGWDPGAPEFEAGYFHHCLALEPLREALPEAGLDALARALKPGGHLVMLQTVADAPLDPTEAGVAAWQRLDGCRIDRLPAELTVTRALGRLGFDIRIVEDLSRRHVQQTVTGWHEAVRGMEQVKPTRREAARLVHEAELWLLRLRLFRSRRLRLVRWHAIGRT